MRRTRLPVIDDLKTKAPNSWKRLQRYMFLLNPAKKAEGNEIKIILLFALI